ncbi:hypothetical protein [Amycolatopsis echigonensis]|uniref:Uncharacterized protein n=1 Tax=Amycolatopsis echigonensis TaxID=2576905 RepID=A0A8E1VUY1_9PSEU|nr:hypothetical protein [Amycolatopsis echigonensis]MBB2498806.1 hypothetical protein [Amycolatopsis echigonensis]
MTTAIISGACALLVAIIAAYATLRAKRLDLIGQSEQRRAESLNQGYDLLLASCDLFWHYRCHLMLDNLGSKAPFNWKRDWIPLRAKVEATFFAAVDQLKRNSQNYDQLAPAIVWMMQICIDGVNLKNLEAVPEDFEEVRTVLVRFSRIDSRMDKPVGSRFWKRVRKDNKPQELAELTSEEHVRRIHAIVSKNPDITYVYQSGPEDDPHDNPLLEFIERFSKLPPLFLGSLAVTSGRIAEWRKSRVVEYRTLCESAEGSCHEKKAKGPDPM